MLGVTRLVAFDPGRDIGYAVVGASGELLEGRVLTAAELDQLALPAGARVVVGSGTGSAELLARLAARGVEAQLVDERGTTLEARDLYFRDHPPRPPLAWLPRGLWVPPRPVDDYAAYAIALRFLAAGGEGGR